MLTITITTIIINILSIVVTISIVMSKIMNPAPRAQGNYDQAVHGTGRTIFYQNY